MVDISTLNPQQYDAVVSTDGPLMILAGAGTGKTRVITYRIAHMIHLGRNPSSIVAVTFTNKAAREMKERLVQIATRPIKGIRIGTFHSFCIYLLKRFPNEAGLNSRFSLAGTSDQLDLIRRSLEEKGWHGLYKADDLLARISRAKNRLLTPDTLLADAAFCEEDDDPELLRKVYELYERQLALHRVIDFDDCILKTAIMLEKHRDVCEMLQAEFTHFLVDEFQDTNFAQLRILELLANKYKNICAVGDDDQSIYSWRGAMVETIDRFETIFTGTKLIKLEQNYRCTNVILNAANAVIKNNSGRKDKTLWSEADSNTHITLASKKDDVAEARWIADKCFALLGAGQKPKDIALLYRANAQARSLEVALRERGLRYKVFGGSSFFERKEVKDFLAYFKLTLDPTDRMAFWRVINTPSRGIGLKSLERIEAAALENEITPFEALKEQKVTLAGKAQKNAKEFVDELTKRASWPMLDLDALEKRAEEIIEVFGLKDDIRQKTSHEGSRRRKLESLAKLPGWLRQMGERQIEDKGTLNLRDLLDDLLLSDEKNQSNEKQNNNEISLMTVHASKGLEFQSVFVCGLEEDLLPHKNSVATSQGLSEERRLFYVALTRAKEKLHLSYARERFSGFQKLSKKPSRFIKELPDQGVIVESEAKHALKQFVSEDEKRKNNISRLSSLKERLQGGFQNK
jgi:DNA helicase-2/ATP-dependent DNA helicase PcrA